MQKKVFSAYLFGIVLLRLLLAITRIVSKRDLWKGEEVLLIFLGDTRKLEFRPKFKSFFFGNASFVFECKEASGLLLTPLANELFLHRKPATRDAGESITLAYRLALHEIAALRYYPVLSKFF